MQGVPDGLDLDEVRVAMLELPGVADVHDLHVWALGSREPILTAHLRVVEGTEAPDAVRAQAAEMLRTRFHIGHSTLQMEREHCGIEDLHP